MCSCNIIVCKNIWKESEKQMDIYQLFIQYNKAWTLREILAFALIFAVAAAVAVRKVKEKKIRKSQAIAGLLFLTFIAIVYASTVFTRNPEAQRRYNLEIFWSWKAVRAGSREMLKESLLNCILLFPAGVLLPFICGKKVRWWQGLLCGIILSFGIESLQLILRRGLFEFDDIIHNSLGCMAGCMISGSVWKCRKD